MFCIPITTVENAKALSQAFYELTRPKLVQGSDNVSQYYCSWIVHPITKAVMLEIPDDMLYIHQAADKNIFDKLLIPFVEASAIGKQELINIQEAIALHKNSRVRIADYIPSYWKQKARTKEQLQQEGWFGVFPRRPRSFLV